MLIRNSFLALAAAVSDSAIALETTTTALDLTARVNGDSAGSLGTGPLATTPVLGWRGKLTPYAARDSAPSPHKKADLGALSDRQRRVEEFCPDSCPDGSVGYCAGTPIDATTCGDTECCIGHNACNNFSGCVKKDGSCAGVDSCKDAAVLLIENSCQEEVACNYVGYNKMVVALKDSCNGYGACGSLSYFGDDNADAVGPITESCNDVFACNTLSCNGAVGAITKSCNGYEACYGLASGFCEGAGDGGGAVTSVTSSCNGKTACKDLADSAGSTMGSINKSCNRDEACYMLLREGGSIKSIEKTCNNNVHKPCRMLISNHGQDVGHLTKFVHANVGEKFTENTIGNIEDCNAHCVQDGECKGIKWKAHSFRPCRFFGGEISENKCNGRNVCITV